MFWFQSYYQCLSTVSTEIIFMAPMKSKTVAPMKTMKAPSALTASAVYSSAAEAVGIKSTQVKAVVEQIIKIAADELKKVGHFKFGGILNLKLKSKPAQPARKGVNPFTKEPMVFKAKPASKAVRVLAMKKLKEMVN